MPEVLSQLARERGPVDAWHLDVEHDHGWRVVLERAHRLLAVTRGAHTEAVLAEHRAFEVEDLGAVVDDEDRTLLPFPHGPANYASGIPSSPFLGFSAVAKPKGLRAAEEVVPKLGVRAGVPALRVGEVAAYDKPIEHLAGHLDRTELDLPLRFFASRYGLVLCFALEPLDLARLSAELTRVANAEGRVWIVVWKKEFIRGGAPSWEAAQAAMLPTGWVDNKVLSLGDEVYATQYVLRKDRRPAR